MENQSHRIFRLVVLLVVMAALFVAIWLLGRTMLNMSRAGRSAGGPAAAATPTPSPAPCPTPTRLTPSPGRVAGLNDAPTASPTPALLTLSSHGDRLPPKLQAATASPTATSPGGGWPCQVSAASLELREGPGAAFDLIELLAAGDHLSASKQVGGGDWVLVETEQRQVGWVYGPGLGCQNDPASLPPAAGLAAQSVAIASPLPALAPTLPPTPTPEAPAGPPTPALAQDYWLGEYFANASLEGQPVLVRQDPVDLEFNWILDSPAPGVPADNFSVRWTRLADFLDGGDYRFYAEADDGVKISVDGQLVLYNWNLFAPITYRGDLHDLSPGLHTVTVEYFESGGHARLKVWVERGPLEDAKWTGQYYANPNWQEPPLLTRPDDDIDFDWGDHAPVDGLSQSDFSIRWRRTLFFAEAGRYRFWAEVERLDRVKIWLDGWLLVDEAKEERGVAEGYFSRLEPGFHTVMVEYADDSGPAKIKFDWERR